VAILAIGSVILASVSILSNQPMSPINESIRKFLGDATLKVAVLKGDWGIGKTFFWRKYFESNKAQMDFRAYSYVSLFGVARIADLQKQIFANFVALDETKWVRHVEKLKPAWDFLKNIQIPHVGSTAAIAEHVENRLIDHFLICFDDLERKENTLSASSVLGLISRLKEEKNCKILLIYNERELDEAATKEINEYREKVVDLELTYAPTIPENLAIIWPGGCAKGIAEVFETVQLNNIRIMQRVKWCIEYFGKEIEKDFPNLREAFERKAAVLTVLHHAYATQFTIEEVSSRSYVGMLLSKDEKEKERFGVLLELDYSTDEYDAVIIDYLRNGYVDFEKHGELLDKHDEKLRLMEINRQHREIWAKYYTNFSTSNEDFIKLQREFLTKHVLDLSLRDFSQAVAFLSELDPSQELSNLEEQAIENFVSKVGDSDPLGLREFNLGPELSKKVLKRLAKNAKKIPLRDVMESLAGSNSWNPGELANLAPYSENDYFDWISTESEQDVIRLLVEFLARFASNENATDTIAAIRRALDRKKEGSALDRRRVELIEKKIQ
jgi:hypothetical protein